MFWQFLVVQWLSNVVGLLKLMNPVQLVFCIISNKSCWLRTGWYLKVALLVPFASRFIHSWLVCVKMWSLHILDFFFFFSWQCGFLVMYFYWDYFLSYPLCIPCNFTIFLYVSCHLFLLAMNAIEFLFKE